MLHKNQKYMHDKKVPGDGAGVTALIIGALLFFVVWVIWSIIKGVFNFIKNIFS